MKITNVDMLIHHLLDVKFRHGNIPIGNAVKKTNVDISILKTDNQKKLIFK